MFASFVVSFSGPGLSRHGARLNGSQAAIHTDDLASDSFLFGVKQPGDGAGDFVRFTDAAERVHRLRLASFFVIGSVNGVRVRPGATQFSRML